MNKAWLAAFMFAMVALSGCSSDDPAPAADDETPVETGDDTPEDTGDEAQDTSDDSQSGGGSGGSTDDGNTTTPAPNTPPTATLEIAELNPAGGQSSFNISVADADGDALSWTFDAEDDGVVDLNGTVNATAVIFFETAGDYVANLTVTDGVDNVTVTLAFTVAEPEVQAPAMEDRGWYIYDPATKLCEVKDYVDVEGLGLIYNSPLSGGDWYILEDNGLAGLQIENNHPAAPVGSIPFVGSFALDVPDCEGGDLVAV